MFCNLNSSHFPLLLKWLNAPHVKRWWDQDVNWTSKLITKKYTPYTQGFKILGDIKKPMHAFVIQIDQTPVGYVQYYNKYDFPPQQGYSLDGLPGSLAAIDFYIGEKDYLGKGIGTKVLKAFLQEYVFKGFQNCFVDPDSNNQIAIRTYEKVGFKIIKTIEMATLMTIARNTQ